MKNFLKVLLIASALSAFAFGQGLTAYQIGGTAIASQFGTWRVLSTTPVAAAGAATITVNVGTLTLPGGPGFQPFNNNAPIYINDGSASETVTPSAETCSGGSCSITATFANAHPGSFWVSSGTGGLDEAIYWMHTTGGGSGLVTVTPDFSISGSSTITSAIGYSGVQVVDQRSPLVIYGWNGTAYAAVQTIAALGAENNCSGVSAAMTAGTITISNTCIIGTRPISLTPATKGGTQGILSYTQSAGSLVISSSSGTDTSTVSWVQN